MACAEAFKWLPRPFLGLRMAFGGVGRLRALWRGRGGRGGGALAHAARGRQGGEAAWQEVRLFPAEGRLCGPGVHERRGLLGYGHIDVEPVCIGPTKKFYEARIDQHAAYIYRAILYIHSIIIMYLASFPWFFRVGCSGYLPDGTPLNRAGNCINHPETIGPDPHTPGSPLPRARFTNSVARLARNSAGLLRFLLV